MAKIKGIGGVFVKSKNPDELKKWYTDNLGIPMQDFGTMFPFRDHENPDQEGMVVWGLFKTDTDYFDPSKKEFMINFMVDDLDGMLEDLKKKGIKQVGKIDEYDYGRFAWIVDPEGTKIELWQPITK